MRRLDGRPEGKLTRRPYLWSFWSVLASIIVAPIAALFGQTAAWATQITQPSTNPFTIPLDSHGTALPFTVSSTGWSYHQLVFIEICDGKSAAAPGWNPASDCDNQTSPSPAPADAHGTVNFPAGNPNFSIVDFHGASPNGQFNCLAPSELPADTTVGPDGSRLLSPHDTAARDGVALNPDTPAWTQCQLRVSSNNAYATSDQRFTTILFPATARIPAIAPAPSSAQPAGIGSSPSQSARSRQDASAATARTASNALADPGLSALPNTGLDVARLVVLGIALIALGGVLLLRAGYGRPSRTFPLRKATLNSSETSAGLSRLQSEALLGSRVASSPWTRIS